ncbi:ABC-type nitrate/sulfonate/bicarbonate transport systems, periplasmic component [Methanosarcina sp. MTP4]|uniref:ABC transporter substrate-binding protein n=1 Tax=Methanosarcina sp. MTP4 TaxID=1434100 RepID=UPI000615D9F8|nr:ABC transporter substrate-binding protein [Methanosarcina sp. MTP4]AKB26664.1 ABC-type nitrate/sulfonate/bicarbonate transport systems, periplasmic component [Methanosarcina sp. MTP4]
MKKLGVLILTLLLVASAFVSGCVSDEEGGAEEDAEEAPAVTELNFGYQPSTHQVAYMTAMEKGWWEEDLAPFGVEKINEYEFPTGAPEMQAMLAGDLDVAYVGAAPVITALSQGLDAKIIAAVQIQGSDLVLRPEFEYETPQDLEGLSIATFPPGTIQDTLLRNWLQENGLDPDTDVDIKAMGPGEAISAISAGSVDAVFLPHPAPAIIESEGNGRPVVASGEMQANHACCVLVASGELIRGHPELVEQIVATHIKATEYNKNNVDEAAQIFADKTGWEVEKVEKSLADWDGAWIADPELIANSTVQYTQVQYELGYIQKPLTKEEIFDTSFYEAASQEE